MPQRLAANVEFIINKGYNSASYVTNSPVKVFSIQQAGLKWVKVIIHRHKRSILLLLLTILIITSVFSSTKTHIIDSYDFDVTGKSKVFMLKRFIVPPEGDPEFSSFEEMIAALDEKQQDLFNRRVFEEVSYTYEMEKEDENSIYYRVTYHVDDSFTFLPIPYPKYDSNYGFSAGLKIYEKNMFGLFGDLYSMLKAVQVDSSWETMDLISEVKISNFPIGTSMLDIGGGVEGVYSNQSFSPSEYSAMINWRDVKIGTSTFFAEGSLNALSSTEEPDYYDYDASFGWSDISLFGTNLNLSGWLAGEQYADAAVSPDNLKYEFLGSWNFGEAEGIETSFITSYNSDYALSTGLRFSDVTVSDAEVSFEPVLVQYVNETHWDLTDVQLNITYTPLEINDNLYALDLITDFPLGGDTVMETSTTLNLLEETIFTMPLDFYFTYQNSIDLIEWTLKNNFVKTGFSSEFNLPLGIIYDYAYSAELIAQSSELLNGVPVARTTQSITVDEVNWNNNFREGVEGSFILEGAFAADRSITNTSDRFTFTAYGEFESFLTIGSRLGLSSRLTGMYSHLPPWAVDELAEGETLPDWASSEVDTSDVHFPQFIPTHKISIPDRIRGILDNDVDDLVGDGAYRKAGAVANLDLTLMFIKFKGFAEGFINAFMDVGAFTYSTDTVDSNSFDPSSLILLKTVGIEGYGILDKFRSYPIRMSLGMNLDDLVDHFQGTTDFSDIGYELTLGMGLHY